MADGFLVLGVVDGFLNICQNIIPINLKEIVCVAQIKHANKHMFLWH